MLFFRLSIMAKLNRHTPPASLLIMIRKNNTFTAIIQSKIKEHLSKCLKIHLADVLRCPDSAVGVMTNAQRGMEWRTDTTTDQQFHRVNIPAITVDHLPKEQINHKREDFLRRQMMVTALTHAKSGPTEIVGYKLSAKIQLLVGFWFYSLDEAWWVQWGLEERRLRASILWQIWAAHVGELSRVRHNTSFYFSS